MNTSAGDNAEVPPAVVTATSTGPEPAGAVAVRVVALTTVTAAAAFAPKVTVEPALNPDPVTVTAVPPVVGPEAGVMEVTVGATGAATATNGLAVAVSPRARSTAAAG